MYGLALCPREKKKFFEKPGCLCYTGSQSDKIFIVFSFSPFRNKGKFVDNV